MELAVNGYCLFFIVVSIVLGFIGKEFKAIVFYLILFVIGVYSTYFYLNLPVKSWQLIIIMASFALYVYLAFIKSYDTKNADKKIILPTKRNKDFEIKNPGDSFLITGGGGSGKTSAIIRHLVRQFIQQNYGIVLYDYKGDLSPLTYDYVKKYNRLDHYIHVNFVEPELSDRINPFSPKYLRTELEVLNMAENFLLILKDKDLDFWEKGGYKIFAAAINTTRIYHPEYCTLPHIVSMFLEFSEEEFLNYVKQDVVSKDWIATIEKGAGNEKAVASFYVTLANYLTDICTPTFFWLYTGDKDIIINNKIPKVVSFRTSLGILDRANPMISSAMKVIMNQFSEENEIPSALIMDEAHTLKFKDFYMIPSTFRSYKLLSVLATQDFSQFILKYSREEVESIISNLGNQFFLRTRNVKAIETLQKMFGKQEIEKKSKSYSKSGKGSTRGKSITTQKEFRFEIDFFNTLETAEAVGYVVGRKKYFHEKFKQDFSPSEPLPIKEEINQDFLKFHYAKIKQEALALKPTLQEEKSKEFENNNTESNMYFTK